MASCAIAGAGLTVVCGFSAEPLARLFLPAAAMAAAAALLFMLREYRALRAARLIVENQILHLNPAVISGEGCGAEGLEVFVSYFGILLDSKIVKFNQGGVHLKAVQIGRDFISFTYGAGKRAQCTRLVRGQIEGGELNRIAERIRYETGVVPEIIQ